MDIINASLTDYIIGGGSGVEARQFLTFGGVNEYGSMPAWTATGDFEIEFDLHSDMAASYGVAGNSADSTSELSIVSGELRGSIAGASLFNARVAVPASKLSPCLIKRVGTAVTITVNGVTGGTVNTSNAFTLDYIGRNSFIFFNGVIANLKLTDTAGGDNRFYVLDGGRSGAGAYELDRLATAGADLVTNGTFDTDTGWTKTGGAAITGGVGVVNGSGGNSLLFQDILTNGETYLVSFDVVSNDDNANNQVWDNSGSNLYQVVGTGRKSFVFTHNDASGNFLFRANGGTYSVDNVSVTETTAMLLNNLVAGDWELFTKMGDDWLGKELVVNGGFDADTDWTKGAGWTIAGGVASFPSVDVSNISLTQPISITQGFPYLSRFDTVNTTGDSQIFIGAGAAGTIRSASGSYTETIIAGSSITLTIFARAGYTGNVDNVSVKRILEAP